MPSSGKICGPLKGRKWVIQALTIGSAVFYQKRNTSWPSQNRTCVIVRRWAMGCNIFINTELVVR